MLGIESLAKLQESSDQIKSMVETINGIKSTISDALSGLSSTITGGGYETTLQNLETTATQNTDEIIALLNRTTDYIDGQVNAFRNVDEDLVSNVDTAISELESLM